MIDLSILKKIEKRTISVEEFIQECLYQDIEYEIIFAYLTNTHNG